MWSLFSWKRKVDQVIMLENMSRTSCVMTFKHILPEQQEVGNVQKTRLLTTFFYTLIRYHHIEEQAALSLSSHRARYRLQHIYVSSVSVSVSLSIPPLCPCHSFCLSPYVPLFLLGEIETCDREHMGKNMVSAACCEVSEGKMAGRIVICTDSLRCFKWSQIEGRVVS